MYLDLVAWPNKNGPDQYGNTHMVCQELSREARDKGERGPIIGNLLLPEDEFMPTGKVTGDVRSERKKQSPATSTDSVNDDDDIPF